MAELPYASSKAGAGREREIRDLLRSVGATAVGFMQDDDKDEVICQFRLHSRDITIPVSVKAYETAWLKTNPCGPRTEMRTHMQRARAQAEIAVWAVLADWIKAQVAMMLCGFLNTDAAFLPHIQTPSGKRVMDVIAEYDTPVRLPPPDTAPDR